MPVSTTHTARELLLTRHNKAAPLTHSERLLRLHAKGQFQQGDLFILSPTPASPTAARCAGPSAIGSSIFPASMLLR